MTKRTHLRQLLAWTATVALALTAAASIEAQQEHNVALASAKITIAGSSNIHEWTASTADVRMVQSKLAVGVSDPNFLEEIVKPGAIEAFEIAIPVTTLKSGKDGLDKNMYKALKSPQIPNITFRVSKLAAGAAAGTLRATGMLKIAGTEREITIDVKAALLNGVLSIKGTAPLVMTDYGIEPPKAMLGMLKTDPKVTVTFEVSLAVSPAAVF